MFCRRRCRSRRRECRHRTVVECQQGVEHSASPFAIAIRRGLWKELTQDAIPRASAEPTSGQVRWQRASLGLPTLDFRFLQGTQADCTHRRLLAFCSPAGPPSSSLMAVPRAMVLRGGRGRFEDVPGSPHAYMERMRSSALATEHGRTY